LRSELVLVHHDPRLGLVTVLLRVPEPPGTRTSLEELGFEPEQSDRAQAISWRRRAHAGTLASTLGTLVAALGDEAVLYVGSHPADGSGVVHARFDDGALPSAWPGRFLVRGRGSVCVVFDRNAGDGAVRRAIAEQDREYHFGSFVPGTE
jgi:hypothetical protein